MILNYRLRVDDLKDDEGYRFVLRDELWLTVYPTRSSSGWRVEADALGPLVVGRGSTPDEALRDWRKRLRATALRYLEMRPFEMTPEDRDAWSRLQSVIDFAQYRSTKPIVVRQVGTVRRVNGKCTVEWEDGAWEKVDPRRFDESFSRYKIGQPFEAVVTRHPVTFRLLRAEAVRKLPGTTAGVEERSEALWNRAIGASSAPDAPPEEIDEKFWLTPPQ